MVLYWPADSGATSYSIYRKLLNDKEWGYLTDLAAGAITYVDTNVTPGGAYEYQIFKSASDYYGEGYIYAGINLPLVESRGKVVLLVDNTFTTTFAMDLARLQQDLAGDGWTVLRHDVPRMAVDPANTSSTVWAARSNEVAGVKALIQADYQADPANVKAVFIFGHVPVPYSGDDALDMHSGHVGAWPADLFYGNMSGTWTDSSVTDTNASDRRNWNVPGDGKFDQSTWPSFVDLQVGRVDLANLPAFTQSETELLRRYLNKDHNFRYRLISAERRGLIDDHFGILGPGEAPAVNGWRNFAPFFSATNICSSSDWFGTLSKNSFLWGYGCGPGTYTGADGTGTTADYATNDPAVVFTMSFGSYFGDWDSQDNFLRAPLATPTYVLTSAWVCRPYWMLHHMALGGTVGFSTHLTQNNFSLYDANYGLRGIHIALMGDPTLRMHVVAPASALAIVTNSSGGVDLTWTASPDTVLGYHVYSAPTAGGPFSRLTTDLVTGTRYTDWAVTTNVYMVRAVKLEVSASGSYYNASQGIFQSLDGTAGAAQINLYQPTNNTLFLAPAVVQLKADTFDPANGVTNVAFFANGLFIGQVSAPPYNLAWSNAPGGVYSVTAAVFSSVGSTATSAPVTIRVDNGGSPRLTISPPSAGSFIITGDEVLGRVYRLQSSVDLSPTNWQTLGSATGSTSGTFLFPISIGTTQQFYRSVYP